MNFWWLPSPVPQILLVFTVILLLLAFILLIKRFLHASILISALNLLLSFPLFWTFRLSMYNSSLIEQASMIEQTNKFSIETYGSLAVVIFSLIVLLLALLSTDFFQARKG